MPNFVFIGRASFIGVTFYVKADDIEVARKKAADGDFDWADDSAAEMVDWKIDPGTGDENA